LNRSTTFDESVKLSYKSTEAGVLDQPAGPRLLPSDVNRFKVHVTGQGAGKTVLVVKAKVTNG
jgi:hypothetical protein